MHTSNLKKIRLSNWLIYIIFFLSSFSLLQINFHSMTFFIVFECIFICYMIFTRKKIYKLPNIMAALLIALIISTLFAIRSGIPVSYRKTAFYMTALLLPNFIVIAYINHDLLRNVKVIDIIRNALKTICLMQLIWACLQFLFFAVNINLNKVVFSDILHINGYIAEKVCGFSWHPATLVPIIALSYYLFDNMYIKLLAVFVGIICNNATALIASMFCLLISLYNFLQERKIKRRNILIGLVLLVVVGIVGFYTGFFELGIEKIVRVYGRITGSVYDQSAIGHIRYYTSFPDVMRISSITQILFGYGTGCSGYPIDQLYNQFSYLGNWSVECDFMNVLYSWGFIGFILIYSILISAIVKGYKVDKRYSYVLTVILVAGITYNVMYDWVLLLIMFFYICINKKQNFWA